jgi:hypothetical protein
VALNLDGGAFDYISRSGLAGSITVGNVTLVTGSSEVKADIGANLSGGASVGTATINAGTLIRYAVGNGNYGAATVNFRHRGHPGLEPIYLLHRDQHGQRHGVESFTTLLTANNGIIGGGRLPPASIPSSERAPPPQSRNLRPTTLCPVSFR